MKRVGVPNKLLYSFSITSLSKATASSELSFAQNACSPYCSASIVSFSHPGWGKGRLQGLPFGRAPAERSLAAGGISWLVAVVSEICLGACGSSELPESAVSGILRVCGNRLPSPGFACTTTDSRSTCRSRVSRTCR